MAPVLIILHGTTVNASFHDPSKVRQLISMIRQEVSSKTARGHSATCAGSEALKFAHPRQGNPHSVVMNHGDDDDDDRNADSTPPPPPT
jgi:hypothetical protein